MTISKSAKSWRFCGNKGSIETTQEVEIYFNFVGRYVPPHFGEVNLTPEEQEALRKKEERKNRLHQNYLRRKANGKQREFLVGVIFIGVFVTLFVLIVRAFLKYLKSSNVRKEKAVVSQFLGETLKAHRTHCQMTQEFVVETIGVSNKQYQNGKMEFPIVKDTTPNMTNPRLYIISYNKI